MSTLAFPPGSVLCLYTDGLVERRDRPIDNGIERRSGHLTATDPEAACAWVRGRRVTTAPMRMTWRC